MDQETTNSQAWLRTRLKVLERRMLELEQQLAAQRQALLQAEKALAQAHTRLERQIRTMEAILEQVELERDEWRARAEAAETPVRTS